MKRLSLLLAILALLIPAAPSLAVAPHAQLNFQGVLRDDDNKAVTNGTYSLTFKLYIDAIGTPTTPAWQETQSAVVEDGVFSVNLGSVTPFTVGFDQQYWVGITLAGESEMTPRIKLTTAPYAMSLVGTSNLFPSAGNVGVGTVSPTFDLCIGDTDTGLDQITDGILAVKTNGVERMRINASGNVGIGTTAPTVPLEVVGNVKVDGTTFNVDAANNRVGIGTAAPTVAFDVVGSAKFDTTTFFVDATNNRVGIGTTAPLAPLHVVKSGYVSGNQSGNIAGAGNIYLGANGGIASINGPSATTGDNTTIVGSAIAAIFDGNTICKDFMWLGDQVVSASDRRAKHIFNQSDGQADLKTLRQLKITNYEWIDQALDNHRPQKKLIAQELEEVYPQAVTIAPIPMAIPNVYQPAAAFAYDATAQKLTVTTSKPHDFKAGDKIDLYTDRTDLKDIAVEAILSDRQFTVACAQEPAKLFVYGKYVTDYHGVDYDAVAMLNVSATQELAKQVETLQTANAALQTTNAALQAQLRTVIGQMTALQAQVNKLSPVEVKTTSADKADAR